MVSITFRKQKNDECDETITIPQTNGPVINPVRSSAYTVHRLLALLGSTAATTVDSFVNFTTGNYVCFQASALLLLFHATVTAMGYDELGFHAHEIGTHSNQSFCFSHVSVSEWDYCLHNHVNR